MMDKIHCIGCDDNFYNGHNPIGVKECWLLKSANLMTRWANGINDPTVKGNLHEVQKPNCYHQRGTVYFNRLPEHCR